jgi:hypothetical protein
VSNETFQTLPVLAFLLELAILAWGLWRRDARPIVMLNGLAAIGLTVPLGFALAQGPERWAEGLYPPMIALFAFEVATLAASVGWMVRPSRALAMIAGLAFVLNMVLTVAVMVFALTFQVKVEL